MVMIFYRICNFVLFAMVGLLQYSKTVWSKVGTPTVYKFIRCISMPENGIISRKCCKMNAIFTMLSSSEVSFQHFQIKQCYIYIYILGVPSLCLLHHEVLFIFNFFFFNSKQKIWIL
jgi:hypothetical protein